MEKYNVFDCSIIELDKQQLADQEKTFQKLFLNA